MGNNFDVPQTTNSPHSHHPRIKELVINSLLGKNSAVQQTTNASHSPNRELETNSLHCQKCRQRYDLVNHKPLVTPCNHVICNSCVTKLSGGEQLQCSVCAESFNPRLSALRLDPHIVGMIEFLNNHRINRCDQHGNQLVNFFCQTCFNPVCSDCTILNHKESKGHLVVSIDTAIEENFTHFDDIENCNVEALRDFQDVLLALEGLLEMIENNEPNEEIMIKNKFDELRKLLSQREENLLLELRNTRQEKRLSLRTEHTRVVADISELSERLENFRRARREGNVQNVFRLLKELKTQDINDRHKEFDSNHSIDSIDATFDPKNEQRLIDATNEFGEIRSTCVII